MSMNINAFELDLLPFAKQELNENHFVQIKPYSLLLFKRTNDSRISFGAITEPQLIQEDEDQKILVRVKRNYSHWDIEVEANVQIYNYWFGEILDRIFKKIEGISFEAKKVEEPVEQEQ